MKEGMFIVFEGIDGAGTTSQTSLLAEWFNQKGIAAHRTWEPSQGKIGRLIREYLAGALDIPDLDRHYHSLALLFAADRIDHLAREVEPNLKQGACVISDRYVLSSFVYQSLHCNPDWVKEINTEARPPHLTFLIDAPVEITMERIARRSLLESTEIYETAEQQEKIREKYLDAARGLFSEHDIIIIDGAMEIEDVHKKVVSKLEPILNRFLKNNGQ